MSHLEPSRDFDFERIRSHPWLGDFVFFDETTSTNDQALVLGRELSTRTPLLVVTSRQTRGRGRGMNEWWSTHGSLAFSLLLDADQVRLPTSDWPRLALWTGLATARALREMVGQSQLQLKWPNDVYLGGRKVGGILVEAAVGPRPRIVIGIGLNVNNAMAQAPLKLTRPASSIIEHTGARLPLTDVLLAVLNELATLLEELPSNQSNLLRDWRELCFLTGRRVEIEVGQQRIHGICRGIDDRGALCIETEEGIQRCYAGVVTAVQD